MLAAMSAPNKSRLALGGSGQVTDDGGVDGPLRRKSIQVARGGADGVPV